MALDASMSFELGNLAVSFASSPQRALKGEALATVAHCVKGGGAVQS